MLSILLFRAQHRHRDICNNFAMVRGRFSTPRNCVLCAGQLCCPVLEMKAADTSKDGYSYVIVSAATAVFVDLMLNCCVVDVRLCISARLLAKQCAVKGLYRY